jgi:hypothetical protein
LLRRSLGFLGAPGCVAGGLARAAHAGRLGGGCCGDARANGFPRARGVAGGGRVLRAAAGEAEALAAGALHRLRLRRSGERSAARQ